MARPTKHKDKLNKVVTFRLSGDEHAAYSNKVTQSGMDSSAFFRECVLQNKTTVIAKPGASLEKRRMQFVINKTGNNLNQIATALNAANLADKVPNQAYQKALADLSEIARYLKAALNHVD